MDLACTPTPSSSLSFEAALDLAARIGAPGIEIAAGRAVPSAAHAPRDAARGRRCARHRFQAAFDGAGPAHRRPQLLRLAAPSRSWASSTPALIRDAIRLAGLLGVDKIVTMSGLPGRWPRCHHHQLGLVPVAADTIALLIASGR